jgi:uncharacterized caspase-like protein
LRLAICLLLAGCGWSHLDPTPPSLRAPPTTHALLIGVSDYREVGLVDLHAAADLDAIDATLRDLGVPPSRIERLHDATATRAGVLSALSRLRDRVQPGDVLFVHFSGHGYQLPDDGRDEPDGLDELLVLHGADLGQDRGLLRDDHLERELASVRAALGHSGHLWLSVDACFSASIFRGGEQAAEPIARRLTQRARPAVDPTVLPAVERAPFASFVLTAAAAPDEPATERGGLSPMGVYTRALVTSLREAPPGSPYHALADRIGERVRESGVNQHPTASGQLDQPVFGGRLEPARVSATIVSCDPAGRGSLASGFAHGVRAGALARWTTATGETATGAVVRAEWLHAELSTTAPHPCPPPGTLVQVQTPLAHEPSVQGLTRAPSDGGDAQVRIGLRLLPAVVSLSGGCEPIDAPAQARAPHTGLLTPELTHLGDRPAYVEIMHLRADGSTTPLSSVFPDPPEPLIPGARAAPGWCVHLSTNEADGSLLLLSSDLPFGERARRTVQAGGPPLRWVERVALPCHDNSSTISRDEP